MSTSDSATKGRVLVADDEFAVLSTVRRLLEGAGYEVVGATDGRSALALLEQSHPDLLLTECRMRGFGAFDLARRAKVAMPALPIVILTAFDDTALQIEAEQLGIAAYLVKGSSSRAILRAVDQAIQSPA